MNVKQIWQLIILLLASTQLYAQTCDEVTNNALFTDKDWHLSNTPSGTPDGRYPEDGGIGPFETIQALIDNLSPGQCGFVRASSTPYKETGRKSGTDISGNTFITGGTSEEQRIVVSGYPGERPLIDGENEYDPNGRPVAGFYVHSGNYITVKNFEIKYTTASGIYTGEGTNTHINIENNYIHHIYARENIGGVRIDGCHYCMVRNNVIHDIYDSRTHASNSNPINDEPYAMHSGVHGYRPQNSIIENNDIFNVAKGIYQKEPNPNGQPSNLVRYNKFNNIYQAAYFMANMGGNGNPAYDAEFHNNLVTNTAVAVWAEFYEATQPSERLKVYNNTLVNTNSLVMVQKMKKVEVYNNIVVSTEFHTGVDAVYIFTEPYVNLGNELIYANNNLFYQVTGFALVDRYTNQSTKHTSLSSWQNATSSTTVFPNEKDTQSLTADPLFVDRANQNYQLQNNSPAKGQGRSGGDLGAYVSGAYIGSNLDVIIRPKPPNPVEVQ